MVFNTDFALQVARDHQARLLRAGRLNPEPARQPALRQRLGAWIVRLGQAVEGAPAIPARRAWQG